MMYHASMQKPWYVYMLRCRDGSLYTGITTNIQKRITTHNAGKGAAYTRSRKPVLLAWFSQPLTETSARRQEAAIKKKNKKEKEEIIHPTSKKANE